MENKLILVFPDRHVEIETLSVIPRIGEFLQRGTQRLRVITVTYDNHVNSSEDEMSITLEVKPVRLNRSKNKSPNRQLP
jgi:hypothetical protein